MQTLNIKKILLLTFIASSFTACIKHEKIASTETIEPLNQQKQTNTKASTYGSHTDEIKDFLSATPLGSKIYLEEKESGEWYLKIEKIFTVKKNEEKTEITEPIYGESILI